MHQAVYDLLVDGGSEGDARIQSIIQNSLQQLGRNVAADVALYESMLLDAATVFDGCNAKAAVCAWSAVDKHALIKLRELIDWSLIKAVNEKSWTLRGEHTVSKLWVQDMIKSVAVRQADTENRQSMTRVWLHDQVSGVTITCNSQSDVALARTYDMQLHALYT
jgi:hypothetical protein